MNQREKASDELRVRVTPTEKASYRQLANSSSRGTLSSLVRDQLQRAVEKANGKTAKG